MENYRKKANKGMIKWAQKSGPDCSRQVKLRSLYELPPFHLLYALFWRKGKPGILIVVNREKYLTSVTQ